MYRAVEFGMGARARREPSGAGAQPASRPTASLSSGGLLPPRPPSTWSNPELQAAAATLNPDPANQLETLVNARRHSFAGRPVSGRASLVLRTLQRLSGGTAFNYLRGLAYYYTGDAKGAEEILALRGSTRGDRRSQAALAQPARQAASRPRSASVDHCDSAGRLFGSPHRQQPGRDLCTTRRVPRGHAGSQMLRVPVCRAIRGYVRDPLLDPLRNEPAFQQISRGSELLADLASTLQIRANLIFARFLRQLWRRARDTNSPPCDKVSTGRHAFRGPCAWGARAS